MNVFPAGFEDLEPLADWAVHSEAARYDKRMASTMDELQAMYDTVLPRMEAITEHLRGVPMEGIGEADSRLLWLACAFITVSFPVEAWRQPKVPDSGASTIDAYFEPAV